MGPLFMLVTRYRETDSLRWELIPLQGQVIGVIEEEDGSVTALSFEGSVFNRE